jgi:predicted RNase H-like HicB family nuclease
VADIPDLRYCSAFGDTPAEAIAEVEKAKEGWLSSAREHGSPSPSQDTVQRSTSSPYSLPRDAAEM